MNKSDLSEAIFTHPTRPFRQSRQIRQIGPPTGSIGPNAAFRQPSSEEGHHRQPEGRARRRESNAVPIARMTPVTRNPLFASPRLCATHLFHGLAHATNWMFPSPSVSTKSPPSQLFVPCVLFVLSAATSELFQRGALIDPCASDPLKLRVVCAPDFFPSS
jgi:hypothetical protein